MQDGRTTLDIAKEEGHAGIAAMLRRKGAKVKSEL